MADMVVFISFKHYKTIWKALELYIAMQKLFSSFPHVFVHILKDLYALENTEPKQCLISANITAIFRDRRKAVVSK